MSARSRYAQAQCLAHAKQAGEDIRFFLDGGNDATFADHDEVACMVLAKLNLLLTAAEHEALLDAAGYEFTTGPMGAQIVRRKVQS